MLQHLRTNPVICDRYCLQSLIGQGSFGAVFKAFDVMSHETVAIKIFTNLFEDCIDTKRSLREIYLLRRINHKNIIKIRDLVSSNILRSDGTTKPEYYLVLDYMPFDLSKLLSSNKIINQATILKIFLQICDAFNYLKKVKLIHRDLKPSNILLDDLFNVKICDLGLARGLHSEKPHDNNLSFPLVSNIRSSLKLKPEVFKNLTNTNKKPSKSSNIKEKNSQNFKNSKLHEKNEEIYGKQEKKMSKFICSTDLKSLSISMQMQEPGLKLQKEMSHHIGTRWYRAPELILLNRNYNYQCDIWSLGCILAELLTTFTTEGLIGPLFPGDSCYPISPINKFQESNIFGISPFDQINVIFQIIGTPSPEDINELDNISAREYVKNFPKNKGCDFSKLFPNIDYKIISLLKSMLEFNPKKRPTIQEIVNNEIFDQFSETNSAMEIENEGDICKIDFETDRFFLDQKDLLLLFMRELSYFHKGKDWEKIKPKVEVLLKMIQEN